MAKKALGKGLGALLSNIEQDEEGLVNEIRLSEIEPNKAQPRKSFDEQKLMDLSESIKLHGVIQPIIVKKTDNGFYQIIAGERRWRAAKMAGILNIPVVVKDYSNKEVMEIALIENIQRQDLNPIEESEAYKRLLDEYSLTQDEVSKRVGKSRPAIANSLRLLNLPDDIKDMLIEEKITSGHARSILSLDSIELQKAAVDKIIKEDMNVRQAEKLVKKIFEARETKKRKVGDKNILANFSDIENRIANVLGAKVKIYPGKNKNKIEIEYYSNEDLERLLRLLKC
jgi:ParB family chromosome partitioning protein